MPRPAKRTSDDHVVLLQKDALAQILMGALEAYVVRDRRRRNAVETYGLIWGTSSVHEHPGISTVVQSLDSVSIDISADRKPASVLPNIDAVLIKHDIRQALFPDHKFLADFHTHPYELESYTAAEIRKNRLYEFSPGDHESYQTDFEIWRRLGLQCSLVITILRTKNVTKTTRVRYLDCSAIEFSLGNYRIWVKAYRCVMKYTSSSIEMQDDVRLLIPYITGLDRTITVFGKNTDGRHAAAFMRGKKANECA